MKKAGYTGLLLTLTLCAFLYGNAFNRTIPVARAGSDESAGAPGRARWEYCAVSRAGYTGSTRGGAYWINYFKETGVEIVEIEEKVSEQQGAQVYKAIAKLGEEGWEMVGEGELLVRTGKFEAIYFKRLKP
ncbi:MAG TPA: hypothetical protein VF528_21145 [Pyrinomonadaceae bacterium]|jgi:hypothetical protein